MSKKRKLQEVSAAVNSLGHRAVVGNAQLSDDIIVDETDGVTRTSTTSPDGNAESEFFSDEEIVEAEFSDFDQSDGSEPIDQPGWENAGRERSSSSPEEGSDSDQNSKAPGFKITEDANGDIRYLYGEIDPEYASDDSDAPPGMNTIGNIPTSFYDAYPHIGYTINGTKIMRPAKGAALDSLLDSIEIPKGWTGLTDPATGQPLELSQEEREMLRKIHGDEIPVEGFDPYPVRHLPLFHYLGKLIYYRQLWNISLAKWSKCPFMQPRSQNAGLFHLNMKQNVS